MLEFTLVIFIYAGMLSDSDAVSLVSVAGFKTDEACQAAGRASESLTRGTKKNTRYVCLKSE